MRGDAAQAVELARMAMENSGEIGGPYRRAGHALSLGQALLRAGDTAAALTHIETAPGAARQINAGLRVLTALRMRAACLLRLGRNIEAGPALQAAWSEGANRDFATTAVWWLPEVMAERHKPPSRKTSKRLMCAVSCAATLCPGPTPHWPTGLGPCCCEASASSRPCWAMHRWPEPAARDAGDVGRNGPH